MNNLKNDRGIAMIAVIGVVLILSIITVGVFTLTNQNLKSSTQRRQKDNALYMAESGVNYLLYELKKQNKTPEEYNLPYTIDSSLLAEGILEAGESFSVLFDHVSGNTYRAVSTGTSRNSTKVINVSINYITPTIFPQKYVDLSATSGEEGYYEDYMENNHIDVAVESVPSGTFLPDPEIGNKDVLNLSGSADYWYEEITIDNGGTLNINGPGIVYINGDLNIKGGSINIQGNDTVEIIVGGNLSLGRSQPSVEVNTPTTIQVNGSVEINNLSNLDTGGAQTWIYIKGSLSIKNNTSSIGRSPAENLVFLFGTGAGLNGGVTMANSSSITGGIYAPTRIVTLNNQASVVGAIVGGSFATTETWEKTEWDSSLLNITIDRDGIWEVGEWSD